MLPMVNTKGNEMGKHTPEPRRARLIAEAPAMADELRRVTDFLHELSKDEQDDPGVGITGWAEVHEAVENARAILARVDAA